jgi:NAD(P)-dependent dehydrogenase (short-subunit alcohol dehydrogenase family)
VTSQGKTRPRTPAARVVLMDANECIDAHVKEALVTEPPAVHVVLGATGGIGGAVARRLTAEGGRLALAARGEERLKALADELDAEAVPTDATDPDAVDALVDGVVERHGRLDGITCCVGSLLLKPAHRTTPEEYAEQVRSNLDTAFFTVRAATRAMQRSGGAIVLVSSAVARIGMSSHEAVAAAKAGVIGLTLAAAASYATKGIRVNCVAPGLTATPMTSRLLSDDTSVRASARLHPMGTIGEPEDVASAVCWLLDPAQRIVTGQVLGVDGGLGALHARR